MIKNAFFVSSIVSLGLLFYLMQEFQFLIPYRKLLVEEYGLSILLCFAVLFFNLLAAIFIFSREFFLKETGEKLAHLEKQLTGRKSISAELSERLAREK